ncbi:nuclear transport factor 2 family protein [Sorangium sp. So ce136]|uniref:nuclear transport factor 2 family protein n=1 Tax=Sorangium sp. So ce136 TaxID=3133284 RepID=UPI003F0A117F
MDTTTMTPGELLRTFYRAMDEPNPALLEHLFTDDAEAHFPGIEVTGTATSIRSALEGMISAGLKMQHEIVHLLEQGNVAMCEMRTVHTVGHETLHVRAAAVCEARSGRIQRLVTYLDASEMQALVSTLNAANVAMLFKRSGAISEGSPAPRK